jgi:hypothetical protein
MSMRAAELIRQLRTLPPDAPVGVLSISRVGNCVDVAAAAVDAVQPAIADDEQVSYVWLIAATNAGHDEPAIVVWPCACGDTITAVPNDVWPCDIDHANH